jgi:hypothetical protein
MLDSQSSLDSANQAVKQTLSITRVVWFLTLRQGRACHWRALLSEGQPAEAFYREAIDRARRELLATGEKARKRTADTRGDPTSPEAPARRPYPRQASLPAEQAELLGVLHRVAAGGDTKLSVDRQRLRLDGVG